MSKLMSKPLAYGNSLAHIPVCSPASPLDETEALERVGFASMLLRRLNEGASHSRGGDRADLVLAETGLGSVARGAILRPWH